MAGLTQGEHEALALFKQHLLAAFPNRVDAVELFGSKARGDATKHSDVDVLVVMKGARRQDRFKVSEVSSRVLLDSGVVLSAKIFSPKQIEEMKQQRAMFWQLIEPDLVVL